MVGIQIAELSEGRRLQSSTMRQAAKIRATRRAILAIKKELREQRQRRAASIHEQAVKQFER